MRIIFINFLIFIYISIIFGKTDSENHRIITVGGSVTEIVYSLGLGNQVVAVDQSSTIPDAISDLPQVGYIDGHPDGPAFSEHGIVWFGKAFVYEDYFSFWFLCRFIAHANYLRDKNNPGEVTITS